MTFLGRAISGSTLLLLLAGLGAPQAKAAHGYTGVYVVMDPYSVADYQRLQAAAATPCPAQAPATPASTFCGGVDGIVLRTGWCNFQTDHATNGLNTSSCHYILGYSNGAGSAAKQLSLWAAPENGTACAQNFDTCPTPGKSTLGAVLGLIGQVNGQRAAAGWLPPLKLSLGLQAGIWTPQSVLAAAGSVDVPHTNSAAGDANTLQCFRLPKIWAPGYVAAYNQAVDQLLAFTLSQMPRGANLTILKASGIVSNDLELQMPGQAVAVAAPGTDPMSPAKGPGPALKCSSTLPGAKVWLNAYAASPISGRSYAQAVEYSFGAIIGHEAAALANSGVGALISIPTTGGAAFAAVGCGMSGSQACSVDPSTGNWSLYYFTAYVNDLFNSGLAGRAAASAYALTRPNGVFAMAPEQLSINWTGVSATPLDPGSQITCTLNNTSRAHASSLGVAGAQQTILGVGTTIGWQTATLQGGNCTAATHNSYMTALNNAIGQGGQFLEVESDAAFANFNSCGPDLAAASKALIASLLTSCQYYTSPR